MNKIIVIIGVSGSGKTTLAHSLQDKGVQPLTSLTSRDIRGGEVCGEDYYFESKDTIMQKDLVESTTYNGNVYALSKSEVSEKLSLGHVSFVSDKHGFEMISKAYPSQTFCVWLSTTPELAKYRMEQRGDSTQNIKERIQHALQTDEFLPPFSDALIVPAEWSTEKQRNKIEAAFFMNAD